MHEAWSAMYQYPGGFLFDYLHITHTHTSVLTSQHIKFKTSISFNNFDWIETSSFFCFLLLFIGTVLAFGISRPFHVHFRWRKREKPNKYLNDRKWCESCKRKFETVETYPIYNKCHKIILWMVLFVSLSLSPLTLNMLPLSRQINNYYLLEVNV